MPDGDQGACWATPAILETDPARPGRLQVRQRRIPTLIPHDLAGDPRMHPFRCRVSFIHLGLRRCLLRQR